MVYLARLASGSRRTIALALDTMARLATKAGDADRASFPWHALRYQHTQALRASLAERYAPATANKHLAALRGVLKGAWRVGLVESEDYHRAVDLEGIRGEVLPAGQELQAGELRALFTAYGEDQTAAGCRDAALLAVL